MKKSALILSYHFYPSAEIGARRPSELARSLQLADWKVTAVAARSRKQIRIDPTLSAKASEIEVIRVTDPPSLEAWLVRAVKKLLGRESGHGGKWELSEAIPGSAPKASLGKRIWHTSKRWYFSIRYLFGHKKAWAILAFLRLLPLTWRGKFAVIVSSGPPMPAHLVAVAAKKLFGLRLVLDMRDPWFLAQFAPAQYQSALRTKLDSWAEQICYRNADRIVCTSPGAGRIIAERCPAAAENTRIVLNGYDVRPAEVSASPIGELRMMYAGAIYFNRNPFPLFEAMAAVLQQPNVDRNKIQFDMFGQCAEWQGIPLQPWLDAHELNDIVQLHGSVDQAEVRRRTELANVLVNFAQGQRNQIPAKTFEHLVSGREVLVVAESDSDTAGIVRDSATGQVVDPGDPAAIQAALLDLYTRYVEQQLAFKTSSAAISSYSRQHQNASYVDELDRLVAAE